MADEAQDPDFRLLDAWRAGDQDAGSELLARQFERLYRFFRTKVPEDEASELIQSTLLRCVEKRDQFRGDARFSTYVFSVARRELIARYRERSRVDNIDPEVQSLADLGASPSGILVEAEQERLLLKGLRRIPIDHQVLLELFYWEGLRGPELAAILDAPEGTIRSRLRRARQLLQTEMVAVAGDDDLARSTSDNFEAWAASLQRQLRPHSDGATDSE